MTQRKTQSFNKVFGIGLSKTGTTSLGNALNRLGIRTADYPHDPHTLVQLERGNCRLKVLESHDALTDTPAVPYYPQFDRIYPGSRFILTVRDKERWLRSAGEHWKSREDWARQNEPFRRFSYFICAAVYGCIDFNEERFGYVYERHLRNVEEYFAERPRDLLVMDICAGEGWEKLCPFLGMPQPDEAFPASNRKEEKAQRIRWIEDLDAAEAALASVVPAGEAIILVDEDQWAGSTVDANWRCTPFPEKGGRFAGRPADDAQALAELRRLRGAGARYLALGWPAFWWLEYYRGLAEYLDRFPRAISTPQVVLFDLGATPEGTA